MICKNLLTCYKHCSSIVATGGEKVNDKALNIKIPNELHKKLIDEAKKKNISLAALVRLICSEYFEKN